MAYSNRLSAKQTAIKAATDLVVAQITAGFVTSDDSIEDELGKYTTLFFDELMAELDVEVIAAPVSNGFSGAKSVGFSGGNAASAGDYKFTWGKMAGQTIAEVEALDSTYLDWLVNKDSNPARNFMRDQVKAFRGVNA